MSEWKAKSSRGNVVIHGKYAIIKGKAYPNVIAGDNKTRELTAPLQDRKLLYSDPAVRLSEADLSAFNGTEGAPLCFEHNKDDVVGHVHHTWLDDDNGLQIVGRVPLNKRGENIVAEIRAGRIAGLSVSYSNGIQDNGRTKNLKSKTFREISLVRKPFFAGCDLTVGVVASAAEGKLRNNKFVLIIINPHN
jgi:HK97 family phage prohead protease